MTGPAFERVLDAQPTAEAVAGDPLVFARHLADLDVPLVVAPAGGREFSRPTGWQHTDPAGNQERLDAFTPGDALCAVLGQPVAVIDVDSKNGGDPEAVVEWLARIEVPILASIATPSGGRHYYVAGHPNLPTVHASADRDGLDTLPGVEILSHGTNVFLPGTLRPKYDGAGYRVIFDRLDTLDPTAGATLAQWVTEHRATRARHHVAPVGELWAGREHDERERAYLKAALERQAAQVAACEQGGRNLQLYEAALKLGSLVAGAGLDEGTVWSHLTAAAEQCGLTRDDGPASVRASIHSGITNGKRNPRPLPDAPVRVHEWPAPEPSRPDAEGDPPDTLDAPVTAGRTWQRVDLAATIAGLLDGTLTRTAPTVGTLDDNTSLFYPGKTNGLAGESGSGKTWTALHAARQVLDRGGSVVYIDHEDDALGIVGRLLDLDLDPAVVADRFAYYNPHERPTSADLQAVATLVADLQAQLVVIDSTGEGLALDGANPNADEEVAGWFLRVPARLAAIRHANGDGPAVLVLDHVTKTDDSGLWPIGSQRKRAAISGAQYMQRTVKPFSRHAAGSAVLVCAKDRLGNYRRAQRVAHLDVQPLEDGRLTLALRAEQDTLDSPGSFRPTGYMERVSRALEVAPQSLGLNAVRETVGGKREHVTTALARLVSEGYVTTAPGPRNSTLHTLVKPFREADDCAPADGGTTAPETTGDCARSLSGGTGHSQTTVPRGTVGHGGAQCGSHPDNPHPKCWTCTLLASEPWEESRD